MYPFIPYGSFLAILFSLNALTGAEVGTSDDSQVTRGPAGRGGMHEGQFHSSEFQHNLNRGDLNRPDWERRTDWNHPNYYHRNWDSNWYQGGSSVPYYYYQTPAYPQAYPPGYSTDNIFNTGPGPGNYPTGTNR
jgi:hypothetical protein